MILTGNLGYFPTEDGALWCAEKVWPRVRAAIPEARWRIAGSRPSRAIRRLARLPGVEVCVNPENLSELRRQSSIGIAPMRAGSGTAIKILEAMADGLPVVCTLEASRGLDELEGPEVSIACDAEDFARRVIRLFGNADERSRQSQLAIRWLREHHEIRGVTTRFESLLQRVLAASESRQKEHESESVLLSATPDPDKGGVERTQ